MNLDKYVCLADETFTSFIFESVGPKGVIKKVVAYRRLRSTFKGLPVYNLGFGDWIEKENKIDDTAVSNNRDRDKVLSTVAATLLSFTKIHEKVAVVAKGGTPIKTRLYQMGINANRVDIEKVFHIYGYYKERWVNFEYGCNYDAFLVIKK